MLHVTHCWRQPAFCLSRGQSPSQVSAGWIADCRDLVVAHMWLVVA